MNTFKRHRFPPEIISHAVWLYYRFNLSHRDVEDLLAERGIIVSYESVRYWCMKFGAQFSRRLKRNHQGFDDTFFMDEVFVNINGARHYLWRAVDQDGEVVDVFLQKRRKVTAAKRFFKRLFNNYGGTPRKIVTDKLGSYRLAHHELAPDVIHDTTQYANNLSKLSHQPTRVREQVMRLFKSSGQAQRFLDSHAAVYNLFNIQRHSVRAEHYRLLSTGAFEIWNSAVA